MNDEIEQPSITDEQVKDYLLKKLGAFAEKVPGFVSLQVDALRLDPEAVRVYFIAYSEHNRKHHTSVSCDEAIAASVAAYEAKVQGLQAGVPTVLSKQMNGEGVAA